MGNRTPRCTCSQCHRKFLNKNALRSHRAAKNHVTKLLQQSRWAKPKLS